MPSTEALLTTHMPCLPVGLRHPFQEHKQVIYRGNKRMLWYKNKSLETKMMKKEKVYFNRDTIRGHDEIQMKKKMWPLLWWRISFMNSIEYLLANVIIKVHWLKEIGSIAHNNISLIEKHSL